MFLRVEELSGGYGRRDIVSGVSFGVDKGGFLGIIGPNGSGKTTLLRLMNKVLKPSSGKVSCADRDLSSMGLRAFSRLAACVMQETYVIFSYTVKEIALMGRIPHLGRFQNESKADIEIVEEALRETGTAHLRDKKMHQLSAGERQRVMIAKALAQKPEILFLDEPTAHLDIAHQTQILDLLRKLNECQSLTIVLVIHDLNAGAEYCRNMVLLDEGRVYAQGTPADVLTYGNIESVYKTVVVTANNPITGKPFVMPVPAERIHRG